MPIHMIILSILLPILGGAALIPVPFRTVRAREIAYEAVTCVTSVLVWMIVLRAPEGTAVVFSFAHGFPLAFQADGMARLFAGMVALMWPPVLLYAYEYMEHEDRTDGFFGFYVMTYGVTLGVAFAANLLTMYVFFEMLTLVTIPLVIFYRTHESNYAGRLYAAYTIGGAGLAFFSVILTGLYGAGSDFVYGGCLSGLDNLPVLHASFILGFFGFGTKAAVFPMHDWLPKASVAPTPVTALLHAVAVVNSGAFAVMRLVYYVYSPAMLIGSKAQILCLMVSVFSLLIGAYFAIRERHFKRKLAYSTMSNLSYMLFGALLMTPAGLIGGMAHMLFHGITKMTLFLCAGAFMHKTGKAYVYEMGGVGRKMPVTFTCYTLGALSLIGIPPLCGFISKWRLLIGGADAGTPYGIFGACALIAAAFMCALYTLPVSVRAFFPVEGKDCFRDTTGKLEAGPRILFTIILFSAACIGFGLFSGPVVRFFAEIAAGRI